MRPKERLLAAMAWDSATILESLGAADTALWFWEPQRDALRLTGAARGLGMGPLAPECSSAALRALVLPQDRVEAEDLLRVREPGTPIVAAFRMRGGPPCLWRGVWLEDGVRAAGVCVPEERFKGSEADPLTGLMDRAAFLAHAREQLKFTGRYVMLCADLDRLSRLNEALGHERADLVLAALGARLLSAFPAGSPAARIGEDEFAVLVSAAALRCDPTETLRAALEQPLRVAGFDIHPTLSIGSVTVEGGEDAPEAAEALRRAALAVEAAKGGRRGGASAYARVLEHDSLSRLALEGDLRGAIGRGEIGPYFQPIVRLSTGALSGFEALARWRHPKRGIVPPDDFLSLLDEMGQMPDLGSHMMREAAKQLSAWRGVHGKGGELTLSVNLSTGEIHRPGLVEDVEALIAKFGLPQGALKLEITESDIMKNPEAAALVLRELRVAGAGLALDDFGTGFSSLSYLTRLPFDTLKIDRYFVRTMESNEGSAKIVSSVVKLGQDLDLEVVAEGVENAQMARRLLELGCDYGQGYGYAPALSPQEAEVYLHESYLDGAAPVKAVG